VDSVADFFAALPARAEREADRTRGLHDTYLFDVSGAGTWTVAVEDGTVTVSEGDTGHATCTIATDEKTFLGIAGGATSPISAFMRGKIRVSGDTGAAMRLKTIFG